MPFTPLGANAPGNADIVEYAKANNIDLGTKVTTYAQGWWFGKIMAEGIKRTLDGGKELNGPNIKAAMEGIQNWDTGGATGTISFSDKDHRGQRSARIFEVKAGAWTQLTDYVTVQ